MSAFEARLAVRIQFYGVWHVKNGRWLGQGRRNGVSPPPRRFAFQHEAEAVRSHDLWRPADWEVRPYTA